MRNESIPVDKRMIAHCSDKCFINWLIKIGKLKKVKKFEPYDITIRIESELEYWALWHRLNAANSHFISYIKRNITDTEPRMLEQALNGNHHVKIFHQIREIPWKKRL